MKEVAQEVKEPAQEVKEPAQEVKEPAQEVKEPSPEVKEPAQKENEIESQPTDELTSDDILYNDDTEDEEEPEISVEKFEHNGTVYLKAEDNVLYNMESEIVGLWNTETKTIDKVVCDDE